MTDEQKGYLQALFDVRSWHRWELSQCLGDVRRMEPHEKAITWLDLLIAMKRQHVTEDEGGGQHPARNVEAKKVMGAENVKR